MMKKCKMKNKETTNNVYIASEGPRETIAAAATHKRKVAAQTIYQKYNYTREYDALVANITSICKDNKVLYSVIAVLLLAGKIKS